MTRQQFLATLASSLSLSAQTGKKGAPTGGPAGSVWAVHERKKGRDYWFYNGGRPHGPAIAIESPATDPRAAIWACFKHDIRVYFYWYSDHWRHNNQKQGERKQDVWANPITFDNRGQPNQEQFRHRVRGRCAPVPR